MKDKKISNILSNIDYLITGLIFIVLVAITFTGVIRRYFLSNPFIWLEEVQLMLFVWITYIGAGAAFRTGSHVAIEFIVDRMPLNFRKAAEVIISLIIIVVLGYFMMNGYKFMGQLMRSNRTTNIFNIPYSLIYSSLPIGCLLMIANYVFTTIIFIKKDKEEVEL